MIKPKKSLGQNFLKSKLTAGRIVACLGPKAGDLILEIGPGTGVLTEHLVNSGARVYAVEIDRRLTNFLSEKYSRKSNLKVIQADINEFDFGELGSSSRIKVIGNLPYHLTAPILTKLCDNYARISLAVLTVQKEVAERIIADPGDTEYGSLTVFLNNFCSAKRAFNLNPREFHPPPKVASTVLKLDFFEKPALSPEKYRRVGEFVKQLFTHRRKMIVNSLMQATEWNRDQAEEALNHARIERTVRPQNLTLEQYRNLFEYMEKHAT